MGRRRRRRSDMFWGRALVATVLALIFLHYAQTEGWIK